MPKLKKEANLSSMVDSSKTLRAQNAVVGKAKAGSAESVLLAKHRGQSEGDALILAIYEGLGGLLDAKKASVNRANEAKAAKRKASK